MGPSSSLRSTDPPRYRFVVPVDGNFHLMVASRKAAADSDPRQFYRLSIVREQPDFRLVIMPPAEYTPDSFCLLRGGEQNFTVLVDRVDGWNGEIQLETEGLPPGVSCPPQTIGAGAKQANLVLSAVARIACGNMRIEGAWDGRDWWQENRASGAPGGDDVAGAAATEYPRH